jgi:hypothetical protein
LKRLLAEPNPKILLVALTSLSFWRLFSCALVWDDYPANEWSRQLSEVHSWRDVLSFQPMPGRWIANAMHAGIHLLAPDSLWPMRLASLVLHILVVLVAYHLISRMRNLYLPKSSPWIPFWITLLFALNPVHCETLGISFYKWEILGALFTLCGIVLILKKNGRRIDYITLFLLCGLAQLSKETFAVIFPSAILIFLFAGERNLIKSIKAQRKFILIFAGTCFFWTIFTLVQVLSYMKKYPGYVGKTGLGLWGQVRLSSRAMMEGAEKMLTGSGLAAARPLVRGGIGSEWPTAVLATILLLGFVACLWGMRKPGWYRMWCGFLFILMMIYLGIPYGYASVGYEHYLYLPSLCIFAILVPFLSRYLAQSTWGVVIVLCLVWSFSISNRLYQFRSQVEFLRAEVESHPESPYLYPALINESVRVFKSTDAAQTYVEQAHKRFPDRPFFVVADFVHRLYHGDKVRAGQDLEILSHLDYPKNALEILRRDLASRQ